MRMRSCQLVYLLLLLCSVQLVDARAAGLLAAGMVGTRSATQQGASAESRQARTGQQQLSGKPATEPQAQRVESVPAEWPIPAGHACAVATFTSLTRA